MIDKYKAATMTNIPTTGKVILKFWAEWCGPCKAYKKDFAMATSDLEDVTVLEINVDQESDLASRFGIRGIPTTLFLVDNDVKGSLVGNQKPFEIINKMNQSFETKLPVEEPKQLIPTSRVQIRVTTEDGKSWGTSHKRILLNNPKTDKQVAIEQLRHLANMMEAEIEAGNLE